MSVETNKLRETIAARLTTPERNKLSIYVKKIKITKSELIRMLIFDFLQAEQNNNTLITNKY